MIELNENDRNRYERQICMDSIGAEGQQKLKNAKVLVVGAGGLGSPALFYLAGAGVGTIGIVDFDEVGLGNLNRQILHPENRIGQNKAESAKQTIEAFNKDVNIVTYQEPLTEENAARIMEDYDFILDCVDNYKAKFLINDVCVKMKKPFSHGGVLKMEGQAMTYVPKQGPCFRCIFEEEPSENEYANPSVVGTLGAIAGVIGSIQAMEAVKYILGKGELLTGKMLIFNGFEMKSRILEMPNKNKYCKACGEMK